MSQLRIHMTPDLQQSLDELMRLRHLKSKAEAIREAIREALARERDRRRSRPTDFMSWLGLGKTAPENPHPRFSTDDDLWS